MESLNKKTNEELKQIRADLRTEILELRFAIAANKETHVRKVRNARRTIARINTLLTARTS